MISVLISPAGQSSDRHRKVRQIINSYLKERELDGVEVSVKFIGSEEMRILNKKHRKIDKPATILTFSQQEGKRGQIFKEPRNLKILGDIVICLEEAKKQGLSLEELLKHGLINLLNFNERSGFLSQISLSKGFRT